MPNQGNKSNGKSGITKPKKNTTMPSTPKQGTASATKHSNTDGQSAAGNSGKGGSKDIPNAGGNE